MTRLSESLPPGAAELQSEYAFQRVLGRGGTAVVYLARDRELDRQVAVKLIRSPLTTDAETLQRFAREARTAGVLRHPNIVAVHAVKRLKDGTLAMIMQYIPGRTLKDVIRKLGPLPYPLLEKVLRDIASALAYAHGRGVVHRDVKPENIFIDDDTGAAVLADFGIARTAETGAGLTLTGVALGTPAYMAPEQIDGTALDGRADLYSLGLVAWEMLTGDAPWEGENLYTIIYKQKHEDLPSVRTFRPDIPFHLWFTIEGALHKDRDRRFADAGAMLAALEETRATVPWLRWWKARRVRHPRAPAVIAPQLQDGPPELTLDETIRYRRPDADAIPARAPVRPGLEPPAARETTDVPAVPAEVGVPAPSLATQAARARRRLKGRSPAPFRYAAAVGSLLLLTGVGATLYAITQYSPSSGEKTSGASAAATLASAQLPEVRGFRRSGGMSAPDPVLPDSSDLSVVAEDENPAERPEEFAAATEEALPVRDSVPTAAPLSSPIEVTPAPEVEAEPREPAVRRPAEPRGGSGGYVAMAAGGTHTCSLTAGGELYCWGGNSGGQVGSGSAGRTPSPTPVGGDLRFREVSAGVGHTCGVTRGGEAVCWGSNDSGQLGDGGSAGRASPVTVAAPARFATVRTGRSHSCGLTRGGEVYCWGDNRHGQLGDGSVTSRTSPVRVEGEFGSISAGWNHTCALDRRGQALCWGDNGEGQLGTAGGPRQLLPATVATRQRFVHIATGGSHSCGLAGNGAVLCWGRNNNGQLGDGTTISRVTPVAIAAKIAFSSLTTGSVHTCGLTAGGEAFCWGRNSYGQLGDGTTLDRVEPVRVEGGLRFTSIHASGAHTCGITHSSEQYCWGYNVEGQLGDGTRSHQSRPVRVASSGR